ncbi:MAG: FliM/FliN family flagellar motor switch protein [Planctomycetota bacterium]|jgi:flagellar motor switch protein FliM
MNGSVMNSLSNDKIKQLLMAVGSEPMEEAPVEAKEYNWLEPHYFNSEQLIKLGYFTDAAAEAMAQEFSRFCRSEFNMTVASTTQHYVHKFLSTISDSEQKNYYVPFGADQEPMCGLVGLSEQAALNWAIQLLGDSESEKGPERDLTQLEESLLLDLASTLIELFSDLDESFDFHSAKSLVKEQWPLEMERTKELCKISFNVEKTGSKESFELYFLILCSELGPVAGKTEEDFEEFSAGEVSKRILGHVQEIPLIITGQLASTLLPFEEIMDLQVNDLLLLDKSIDQPMELIVDGRTIFYGHPVKSEGKYAVKITNQAEASGSNAESINST